MEIYLIVKISFLSCAIKLPHSDYIYSYLLTSLPSGHSARCFPLFNTFHLKTHSKWEVVVGAESHLALTVLHLFGLKENFNSSEGSKLLSFSRWWLPKKPGGVVCNHVTPAWDQVAPGRVGSLWCSPWPPLPPCSPPGRALSTLALLFWCLHLHEEQNQLVKVADK